MIVSWCDPKTNEPLNVVAGELRTLAGVSVARIVDEIPRFVDQYENYAESFGFQWKRWKDARSDERNPGHNLKKVILERTRFDQYDLEGKTLLECGMGGGDDTEILLQLPLAEVHSFDLSTSVERAKEYLHEVRLHISQASIFDIPYPDESFDVVYCHRVLQHTPDPLLAVRKICRKVKPGGILFAHAYKRSKRQMAEWRYKYRWLTKRLPWRVVAAYVDWLGPSMHRFVQFMHRKRITAGLAYRFVPFYYMSPEWAPHLTQDQLLEMTQHITFDAMTPWHDHPMKSEEFRGIIESEGFDIQHMHDPEISPLYCTAVRKS